MLCGTKSFGEREGGGVGSRRGKLGKLEDMGVFGGGGNKQEIQLCIKAKFQQNVT